MTRPASKPDSPTYQDVLDAPDGMTAEILAGELVLSPRPASPHRFTQTVMGQALAPLNPALGGGGGGGEWWWNFFGPELHLGADVLVPDLAGWRTSTMPSPPNVSYFEQSPDWICEVLSPSTASRDRLIKMALYAAHGVDWAWLVDPLQKHVEVFRRQDDAWMFRGGSSGSVVVEIEPFSGLEFNLGALWLPTPEAEEAEGE